MRDDNGHGIHGRTRKNKCRCRVRFTHRQRCMECALHRLLMQERTSCAMIMATESTEEHGKINAGVGCVLRTGNGVWSVPCTVY